MLLLFETSAGYALFKVLKPGKIEDTDNLWKDFETVDKASGIVKLKAFTPFENTTEAVAAATSIIESTMHSTLKKFLKKNIINKSLDDELAVSDIKLGGLIKDKMDIQCVCNDSILELFRGVRTQIDSFIGGADEGGSLKPMQLGLSHSLSRYKLKFTADKVDIMIVQAIGLLEDLDKEINIYAMRVREWYGWHFPEMAKIMNDNMFYAKVVQRMGMRTNCKNCDFSDILGDESLEGIIITLFFPSLVDHCIIMMSCIDDILQGWMPRPQPIIYPSLPTTTIFFHLLNFPSFPHRLIRNVEENRRDFNGHRDQ